MMDLGSDLKKSDIGIMDEKAKRLWMKNPKTLTGDERKYLRAAIVEAIKSTEEVVAKLRQEHPFWYYEPVTGELSEDRMNFLLKHLRAEDIPQKVDGALGMHLSTATTRVVSGGNQSSKTYSATVDNLIAVTGHVPYCFQKGRPEFKWEFPQEKLKRDGPQHIRVIGFDWENDVLKNLLPKYRDLAPKEFLIDGSFDKSYIAGERTLYLRENGKLLGTIEFMSNKQDLASFGGPPRRRVSFDEEPFEAVFKENLMRMVTSKSFEVLMSYTPVNGMSWSHDRLYARWENGDKSIAWFNIPSVANPHSDLSSLEEIVKDLSYEEKKMRLLGSFVSLTGLVYGTLFSRDIHVIPPFNTACQCSGDGKNEAQHAHDCPYAKYMGFLGVDAHMVKPSVACMAFIDRDDNFIVDRCYKKAVDTDEFKSDLQDMIRGRRIDWSVFDPSNDSSITAFRGLNIFYEMTHGTNRLRRAFKGDKYQGSISAGVDTIKKRLKLVPHTSRPTFYVMNRPENQDLIKSMRTLQRDSVINVEKYGQPDKIREGEHDEHAAMRYILQNRLNWKDHMPVVESLYGSVPDEEAMLL